MKTTLGKILSFDPCTYSWKKALQTIKKAGLKYDPNIEVTPKQILEVVGIKDAVWCLRCFKYKEYCLFLADVAESVYPIYKKYDPHDYKVWNCIQSIHYYYHGFITKRQLFDVADAAYAVAASYEAADTAEAAVARAAAAATATYAIAYAAATATTANATYAYAVTYAARAAYAAARAAAYAAARAAADAKWKEIEEIFIQHFCE